MPILQSQNRGEIRRIIGAFLGICIDGTTTSEVPDTSSILDTANLQGGDDTHNGKQVMIYETTDAAAPQGVTRFVTDYAGGTSDATTGAFTAAINTGDKFEMWSVPWRISDINKAIDLAFHEISRVCLQIYQALTTFTKPSTYEYSLSSSFVGLNKVEHVSSIGTSVVIDNCDSAWTAGTNATVTADTTFKQEGSACNKIVVVSAGADEELAYTTFSAIDLSGCSEVEISVYSTIALVAGYVELRLDDTAGGGSALESLDIPATTANTWTRHKITLANPLSDTAIVRASIHQVTDQADCTIYIDYILAVDALSRVYKELNPEFWSIVRGSTNYLKLTKNGLSVTDSPTLLRLNGYRIPALLSDDTTDSEVDPSFIINFVVGNLLIGHAKSSRLEIEDRLNKSKFFLGKAEAIKNSIGTETFPNTIWI